MTDKRKLAKTALLTTMAMALALLFCTPIPYNTYEPLILGWMPYWIFYWVALWLVVQAAFALYLTLFYE
ncbi:MAG: hypothetical protein QXW19_05665 [Candidatus Bathyarchaeia archaeon]